EVKGSTIEFKGKRRLLAILRDVTERKKAEEEREKLTKELLKSNEKLKESSLVDAHTGLYNHHYLEDVLEAEFYRARRSATTLALIMMDINYFKSVNEVYGHHFGDLVLRQFAAQLKRIVRKYDIVVRFGGEEFIIISPGVDKSQALILAQRFLDSLSLYNFGDKKHSVKLKVSIGVASYPEDRVLKGMDLVGLLERVLTRVKEDGGDRVYSFSDIAKEKSASMLKYEEQKDDVKLLKDKMDALSKRANQSVAEAISAFAKTIELKDHYTGEHVERTVNYAAETAMALGLPKEDVGRIKQAAILHDLGKIGISEKILMKKGKLTEKEFEEIKKHPLIAVDIIRPIQFFHDIIPLILYHHERWDGKGYPYGLKRDEIPMGAQVISIADEYQALISDRPYRKAYTEKEAMEIIKQEAGTRFDPAIVNVFIKVVSEKK
ncbi:MAG: diguanylate cyclase, partial [Candidatus Omnitrophica bacterium]|nr:diguanylate cyclase [Candidatus Omnitrophota bacterium]